MQILIQMCVFTGYEKHLRVTGRQAFNRDNLFYTGSLSPHFRASIQFVNIFWGAKNDTAVGTISPVIPYIFLFNRA